MDKEYLTLKEQEQLLKDMENLIGIVIAQKEFIKSKGLEEEAKEFIGSFWDKYSKNDMKEGIENGKYKKEENKCC